MKKILFITVVAFLGFTILNAQNADFTDKVIDKQLNISGIEIEDLTINHEGETTSSLLIRKISLGFIVGFNNSTISGSEVDSFDCRTCFHFGFIALLSFSDEFAIQPELLYSCLGSGYAETGYIEPVSSTNKSASNLTGTYKLDYLLLPVTAKYYIFKGLSLEAGPQVGFLLSAKDEYDFNGTTEELDVKDQTKGIDFGVNAGVGYKFDMGIYLRGRYYLGITELNDLTISGNESWKNNAFQLSAGYFLN